MSTEILVSIICMVYNQESYVAQCLDGLVNQKTDFNYEILVHDDASTDLSASIIREYAERYPQKIKPIFQSENQYSQGVRIYDSFMYQLAQGKYLAYCEGDDYWTDSLKLQKQVSFLENHLDFSACYSSYDKVDVNGKFLEQVVFEGNPIYKFEDTLLKPMPQTATCVMRKEVRDSIPEFCYLLGVGDIRQFNWAGYCGKIKILSDRMSCYRIGGQYSWTVSMRNNKQKQTENLKKAIKYYEAWDNYTEQRYYDIFKLKADWSRLLVAGKEKRVKGVFQSPVFKSFPLKSKILFIIENFAK